MKTTPVSKLKDFQGPKSHYGILCQIHSEAKELGYDISQNYIDHVIRRFFSISGIAQYINKPESFYITGLGHFQVEKYGRKYYRKTQGLLRYYAARRKIHNEKVALIRREKRTIMNKKKRLTHRLFLKRRRLFSSHTKLVANWNKINNRLLEKGLKTWTWSQFCRIKKRIKFIKYGIKPSIRKR